MQAEHPTPEEWQVIAGFFDGDGCVRLAIPLTAVSADRAYCTICFTQAYADGLPPEIERIREMIGGSARVERLVRHGGRGRTAYNLVWGKTPEVVAIARRLIPTSAIKYAQLARALLHLLDRSDSGRAAKADVARFRNTAATPVQESALTLPYLAGLFMAEGSVGIYGRLWRLMITQKSCLALLEKLCQSMPDLLNDAVVAYGSLKITKRSSVCAVLKAIRPYIFGQKADQVDLILSANTATAIGRPYFVRSADEKELLESTARLVKRLKRR